MSGFHSSGGGVAPATFEDHSARHEDGGADEIVATGLTGAGGAADATYVVEDAHGTLSAEVVLGTTVITQAAYAARQAAAKAGRLFLPSDSYYFERDDGAAWDAHGPVFPLVVPPSAGWTAVNHQGSDTVVFTKGAMQLRLVTRAANSFSLNTRSAPATPYTITAGFRMFHDAPGAIWFGGVGWRQSSDGKLIVIGVTGAGAGGSSDWDNATTFNGNNTTFTTSPFWRGPELWVQFADDGTNRKTRFGPSPHSMIEFQSEGRTVFLTADQVWFGGQGDGTQGSYWELFHWAVT